MVGPKTPLMARKTPTTKAGMSMMGCSLARPGNQLLAPAGVALRDDAKSPPLLREGSSTSKGIRTDELCPFILLPGGYFSSSGK